MSRPKRGSKILDKAQRRLAGLKSISTSLDLGNGLTLEAFLESIEKSRQKLENYNMTLSMVDQNYNTFLESEQMLAELYERMLNGVACKYGKNSDEYLMAGGTVRRRKKRVTKQSGEQNLPAS
ncbi:MAG: hypothetical protein KME23_08575 [Goleter apudmare HA4340-LM2]|jgi:hypothetical protein|nr:hypothetical protein [Goleter apudmare HA4340-LM2]